MLPPILEIFIVWHPDDADGARFARTIFAHFMQRPSFLGVIGGGIQVSLRSVGWKSAGGAPRPIYSDSNPAPNGISPARFVAVIPLLGTEMAANVGTPDSPWHHFATAIREAQEKAQDRFAVFPYLLSDGASDGTELGRILGKYQFVATNNPSQSSDDIFNALCRDITQGVTQFISPNKEDRLTVFISHTKQHSCAEGKNTDNLIRLVREVIGSTRLGDFFDANDLQPGSDWGAELIKKAGTSAMLAIRTDLYSSREWCQREVVIAKTHGMPVIMMDAVHGEDRGSFLMDHVPRVSARKSEGRWQGQDVRRALNLLVNECLKRALWVRQKELALDRPELDVSWWAPHAPEPLTLSHWISSYDKKEDATDEPIRILHPDPPLGLEEQKVLLDYARNTRLGREIDIMTPRQLAMRDG